MTYAFFYFLIGGHSDVVSLLVDSEADIDSQDNRKVSCLMAAFRRGHIKVVKWMVKKVSQFPSENEIKRYIATVTDKVTYELGKIIKGMRNADIYREKVNLS